MLVNRMTSMLLALSLALASATACKDDEKGGAGSGSSTSVGVSPPKDPSATQTGSAAGEACAKLPSAPPAPQSGQITLSVQAGIDPCSVKGYVVGAESSLSVQAVAGGTYVVDQVPPGSHDVVIVGQLGVGGTALTAGATHALRIPGVAAVAGERTELGKLDLPPAGRIVGRVLLAEPEGVADHAGIDVFVPGTSYRAKTDVTGGFVMGEMPVGTHDLLIERDGYRRAAVGGVVVLPAADAAISDVALRLDSDVEGGLVLAGGRAVVTALTVEVELFAASGAAAYKLSESSLFSDASLAPLVGATSYTFATAGPKTLYVQYANANGLLSSIFAADVVVDTAPPSLGLEIVGNLALSSKAAKLRLIATDEHSRAVEMQLGESADLAGAAWVAFAPEAALELVGDDGEHVIYGRVRDLAGFESTIAAVRVVLDRAAPEAPAFASSEPRSPSADRHPRLRVTAAAETRVTLFSDAACAGEPLASATAAVAATDGFTVDAALGKNRYYVSSTDVAGNVSPCSSAFVYVVPRRIGRGDNGLGHTAQGDPVPFATVGGVIYYLGIDDGDDGELWRSDGTLEGTRLAANVFDIASGNPTRIAAAGGKVYFNPNDGVHGRELWVVDDSPLGAHLVKDIEPGVGSSFPGSMAPFGDRLVFAVNSAANGGYADLWITDGTADGTFKLADKISYTSSGGVDSRFFAERAGKLYFAAEDAVGFEPWVSDGSLPGTHRLADLDPGVPGSEPQFFVAAGDRVLFTARVFDGSGYTPRLFETDGTEPGTVELGGGSEFQTTSGIGAIAFKGGTLASSTSGLHFSDGGGFSTLKTLDELIGIRAITRYGGVYEGAGMLGDKLVFGAEGGVWVTDATSEGTLPLIPESDELSTARSFCELDGVVYFMARSATDDSVRLWATDGTLAGSRVVQIFDAAHFNTWNSVALVRAGSKLFVFLNQAGTANTTLRVIWALDL